LIQSIPVPVMGGVSVLLFGLIAANGLRMYVTNDIDFSENRNLMIAATVLIVGIGMETTGTAIPLGPNYVLPGMATAALLGVLLNGILPKPGNKSLLPDPDTNQDIELLDEQGISIH
ncbi:MAG: solute carrier family 23 protein, partial [Coriobacteriia bacterium]|nr:solute carrier family 23 protein [Coriobacteriia bacterium]